MASFLGEVGYRDLSLDSNHQRLAVSRRLWREGVDERILRLLHRYAESQGSNPTRLFCWWMARPSRTIDKINEMRQKSQWLTKALDATEASRTKRDEPAPVYKIRKEQA